MLYRLAPLLLVVAALATATACPPKPADAALPPAGLAGAPGGSASLALPGAGVPVASPSGTANPGTALPAGHPPIDGMAGAAADASAPAAGQPGGAALPASLTGADMAAPAAPAAPADPVFTGTVAETVDVPEYTYMRVQTAGGEQWVAVTKTPIAKGDVVTVSQNLVMENFHSKSLNRTFPKLVMGMLVGAPKKP